MAAPPELIDDAIAEILLRLPPDDPACLARAALVCKPWRRVLSDPAFPRRYREFHPTPPLLGFLHNRYESYDEASTRFVAAAAGVSPFSPTFYPGDRWTLDCRHGRVLFRCIEPTIGLVVWDPITGNEHYIPDPETIHLSYVAAVLCAVDGCDHLNCHSGPFLVVVVRDQLDCYNIVTRVCVYSSEIRAWSDKQEACIDFQCDTKLSPCLLAGDALYFMGELDLGLVKYDLGLQDLSVMDTPKEYHEWAGFVMTAEGDRLGLASVQDYSLHLWSLQAGATGTDGWVHRVIDLKALLPVDALSASPELIGYAEGSNTIFMNTSAGAFAMELNSKKVRKIGEKGRYSSILPYMSFYTPGTEAPL
ncbi:hypothetical protein EJB05_14201, partial [Eragrostis curvula]